MKLRRFLKLENHNKMFAYNKRGQFYTANGMFEVWGDGLMEADIESITVRNRNGERQEFVFEIADLVKGRGE